MDKKEKRLSEFKDWINGFAVAQKIKSGIDLVFIDNAAEILNDRYWEYAESYIRPIIDDLKEPENIKDESKISRFKIISASELTIIDVQPIALEEDKHKEKRLNAEFGWFVGFSILSSFSETPISDEAAEFLRDYKEEIPDVDTSKIVTVYEEHIQWLCNIEQDVQLPIISNAQTWRLYYFSLLSFEGKIKRT